MEPHLIKAAQDEATIACIVIITLIGLAALLVIFIGYWREKEYGEKETFYTLAALWAAVAIAALSVAGITHLPIVCNPHVLEFRMEKGKMR